MIEINRLSATEAVRRIAEGAITAEGLVRACLERIGAREDAVGAWEFLDADRALSAARRADAAGNPGPLKGLPAAVKDVIDTADMPTAYGSSIYRGHRPVADAACVARARAAGAVILGKTVTTEFAHWYPGKTRHPHDPARTPGGSSSGSAAAVADFMAPLAFGTQTGGSTNRPASFCGVVGFKPTYGLHPMDGIKVIAPAVDTLGFFGRTVADVALFAAAVGGDPPCDLGLFAPRPPRIGLCRTPWWSMADGAAVRVFQATAETITRAGAGAVAVDLPEGFADLLKQHHAIVEHEVARALAGVWRTDRDRLSDHLRQVIERGRAVPEPSYRQALATVAAARDRFAAFFGELDALLTLSATGEAPLGLGGTGNPIFSQLFTLMHAPTITVPAGKGEAGLPIGVQIVGRRRDDARALAVAAWVVRAIAENR